VQNVAFADLRRLVETLGFRLLRTSGSHHIFGHPELIELINLQDVAGEAKPYQV
jgi:predicted RNA binding protein YcfA (HicA-like mRNA interferase family)